MFLRKVTGVGSGLHPNALARLAIGSGVLFALGASSACSATDSAAPPGVTQGGTKPGTDATSGGTTTTSGTADPAGTDTGAPPVGDPSMPGTGGTTTPTATPTGSATAPATGGTGTGTTTAPPATTGENPVFVDEGGSGPVLTSDGPAEQPKPEDQLVDGMVCNSQDVTFTKTIPTVMLVLDRSTSMFASNLANGSSPTPWGSFPDRWEALRAAVGALEPFSQDVQFAGVTYTGYMSESNGACPEMEGTDIVPALGNIAAIQALLPASADALPPAASETPTAEGIEAALAILQGVTTEGPKYLVLVTDGLPDLCAGRPALINKGPWCAHDPAYAVVQNAFMNGITTYVIGIGDFKDANEQEASEYFLNGLAHAGQGLPVAPNPLEGTQLKDLHCIQQESEIARGVTPANDFYENWRPYAAATYGEDGMEYTEKLYLEPDDATLGPKLAEVVAGVRSCSFEMDDTVVRAQAGKGAVRLETADGVKTDLVYDDPNGWALDAANDYTVVIQGTACESVKTQAEIGVKIQFPCEIRVPRVR